MVSGLAEIASVGQTPTHTAQPSGHRAESSFGLPRNRAGVDAAITSGITGCPSANRTTSALGRESLISKLISLKNPLWPDWPWRGVACGAQRRLGRLQALQAAPLQAFRRRMVFQQNRNYQHAVWTLEASSFLRALKGKSALAGVRCERSGTRSCAIRTVLRRVA